MIFHALSWFNIAIRINNVLNQLIWCVNKAQQHSDVRMSYRIFLLWIFQLKHLYNLKTFLTQISRLQTNLPVSNSLFLQLQGFFVHRKLRIITECKLALIFDHPWKFASNFYLKTLNTLIYKYGFIFLVCVKNERLSTMNRKNRDQYTENWYLICNDVFDSLIRVITIQLISQW